jgi:hypothetical protein
MTTTVTIEAHCDARTKQVEVSLSGTALTLEDGDSYSCAVYDDLQVSVREIEKVEYGELDGL